MAEDSGIKPTTHRIHLIFAVFFALNTIAASIIFFTLGDGCGAKVYSSYNPVNILMVLLYFLLGQPYFGGSTYKILGPFDLPLQFYVIILLFLSHLILLISILVRTFKTSAPVNVNTIQPSWPEMGWRIMYLTGGLITLTLYIFFGIGPANLISCPIDELTNASRLGDKQKLEILLAHNKSKVIDGDCLLTEDLAIHGASAHKSLTLLPH